MNVSTRPVSKIAAAIFGLIAVGQLLRLLFAWKVTISAMVVPMWVSGLGLAVAAILAVFLWLESQK